MWLETAKQHGETLKTRNCFQTTEIVLIKLIATWTLAFDTALPVPSRICKTTSPFPFPLRCSCFLYTWSINLLRVTPSSRDAPQPSPPPSLAWPKPCSKQNTMKHTETTNSDMYTVYFIVFLQCSSSSTLSSNSNVCYMLLYFADKCTWNSFHSFPRNTFPGKNCPPPCEARSIHSRYQAPGPVHRWDTNQIFYSRYQPNWIKI